MKKQYYLLIFIFLIFGLSACSDNPNLTTLDLTSESLTSQPTDIQTTSPIETNDNQTTIETTTDIATEQETEAITTDLPSTQTPTTAIITEAPTTTQPTTQAPTTIETTIQAPTTIQTTQAPTTIFLVEITLDDSIGSTYDILSGSPGDIIILPTDPTRENYIFEDWYVDQAYSVPFTSTVFPNSDITIYAKWIEDINPADLIMDALEADYDFVCNESNVCTYQQYSWLTYTFNFNNLTFTKELIDDDSSEDQQTKHELVIIDENWNFTYSLSIQYLSGSPKTINGSGQTDNYDISDFSSSPSSYLSESNVYDDAVSFINDAVVFLEIIVENLGIDYNDLN